MKIQTIIMIKYVSKKKQIKIKKVKIPINILKSKLSTHEEELVSKSKHMHNSSQDITMGKS